jgi:hypothetical protein
MGSINNAQNTKNDLDIGLWLLAISCWLLAKSQWPKANS